MAMVFMRMPKGDAPLSPIQRGLFFFVIALFIGLAYISAYVTVKRHREDVAANDRAEKFAKVVQMGDRLLDGTLDLVTADLAMPKDAGIIFKWYPASHGYVVEMDDASPQTCRNVLVSLPDTPEHRISINGLSKNTPADVMVSCGGADSVKVTVGRIAGIAGNNAPPVASSVD